VRFAAPDPADCSLMSASANEGVAYSLRSFSISMVRLST